MEAKMATASLTELKDRLYTTEDLLALPDDGKERWLIRGQLREKEMTRRNRFHAALEARLAQLIGYWLDSQPEPRGQVYSGEAGVRLRLNPDTSVGIDVVYFPPGVEAAQTGNTSLIEGAPALAVEILSPSDMKKEVTEKVNEYLAAGVLLVWVIDPDFETITFHRPGRPTESFNATHMLSADPHLPDFSVPVSRVFRR
jgi:Uma2 family endonuclease